jgi:hypothetical protein
MKQSRSIWTNIQQTTWLIPFQRISHGQALRSNILITTPINKFKISSHKLITRNNTLIISRNTMICHRMSPITRPRHSIIHRNHRKEALDRTSPCQTRYLNKAKRLDAISRRSRMRKLLTITKVNTLMTTSLHRTSLNLRQRSPYRLMQRCANLNSQNRPIRSKTTTTELLHA